MTPIEFPEQTIVWAKNQPPYLPLPAYTDERETCVERTKLRAEQAETEVARLEGELAEARRFGEMAASSYNDLLKTCAKNTAVTCAFCGTVYPAGTPRHGDGLLAEHIKTCPQHPMRVVEAERDTARRQAFDEALLILDTLPGLSEWAWRRPVQRIREALEAARDRAPEGR